MTYITEEEFRCLPQKSANMFLGKELNGTKFFVFFFWDSFIIL